MVVVVCLVLYRPYLAHIGRALLVGCTGCWRGGVGVVGAVVGWSVLCIPVVSVDMSEGAAVITLSVGGVCIVFVGVISKSDGYRQVGSGCVHIV